MGTSELPSGRDEALMTAGWGLAVICSESVLARSMCDSQHLCSAWGQVLVFRPCPALCSSWFPGEGVMGQLEGRAGSC